MKIPCIMIIVVVILLYAFSKTCQFVKLKLVYLLYVHYTSNILIRKRNIGHLGIRQGGQIKENRPDVYLKQMFNFSE